VFPVDGSLAHGAPLPSRGFRRPRFPTVSSTMRALRPPVRAFLIRYDFRFRLPMLLRHSCSPWALPGQWGIATGPGSFGQPVSLCPASRMWSRTGSLRFPGDPSTPLPCSQTPAGPARPRRWRSRRCCPRSQHAEGSSRNMISRLTPGLRCLLPTLHERRCRRPCKARFRLAGCAFAGRKLNPLDRSERFQATSILLPRTSPDASWAHLRR
jgi:hypothetical protein